MKTKFYFIILATMCQIQLQAQVWDTTYWDADELLGTPAYQSFTYADNYGNSIVFWSSDDIGFRIITEDYFFDDSFHAIIGYYDNNDVLLEKNEIQMWKLEGRLNQAQANLYPLLRPVTNKPRCKQLHEFIQNSKGYVRIAAPLYGTNLIFDLKVPCVNN